MKTYTVRVDNLNVRVSEEGQGEPVVLLHGWGASYKIWRPTIEAIHPHYRVIALDWPGFGESDKPDVAYSIEWYSELLLKVLDELHLACPVVVGHSMGGQIAALFALDHPDRVRKLVLVNAIVEGPTSQTLRTRLLTLPGIRRMAWWMCGVRWFRHYVAKDFTHAAPLAEEVVDDIPRASFASMIRTIWSMEQTNLTPRLSQMRVTTLVVNSDRDAVLRPTQFEAQKQHLRTAQVAFLAETGHCPMQERPAEFNRALGTFLSSECRV